MSKIPPWCAFFTLGLLAACPKAHAQAPDTTGLAAKARAVFEKHCVECHAGPGNSKGGTFHALSVKTMTAPRGGKEKPYIVRHKPADSYIYQRLAVDGDMPERRKDKDTGKEVAPPTDAEKKVIKDWIEAGAPPFPARLIDEYVDTRAVLADIEKDLSKAALEDRPHLRYFTLTHLYNNPDVPERELRLHRAALSKVINSLSWKYRIILPRAIDKHKTVFAIDVRRLGWTKDKIWKEVVNRYPYGLSYNSVPGDATRKAWKDITKMSGCDLPMVRADWFVVTATRPPLYHDILRLPKTAGELERRLDVDVVENFNNDDLARAGFDTSLVSTQNRMVERHEALFGAYWKSYDFKPTNKQRNITLLPLGPAFKGNPFAKGGPDLAFTQDGGEIIFNLPNGFQGYMLVDAKDRRLEVAAPPDVVTDSQKFSGSNEIVNGLSCMGCHKHGMLPVGDQVRGRSRAQGLAALKVKQLYPEGKKMQSLIQGDADRFLQALERATGQFLREAEDKEKGIRDFPEPIGEVARRYHAPLTLDTAAYELDISRPEELKTKFEGSEFSELGMGPLSDGKPKLRQSWQEGSPFSLYQRVSRELGKGTPRSHAE